MPCGVVPGGSLSPGAPGRPGPPGRDGSGSGSTDVGQYIAQYLQSELCVCVCVYFGACAVTLSYMDNGPQAND